MTDFPLTDEISKQKELIGEFIIEFEQICANIRFVILKIFYPDYTQTQSNNIEILLENLTADPLRKKLDALIIENYQNQSSLIEITKQISNRFAELYKIRNTIAHGSMLLGWSDFNGDLSPHHLLLKKSQTTRSGIDRNSMIINVSELNRIIELSRQIKKAYTLICVLIDLELIPTRNYDQYLDELIELGNKIKVGKLKFEKKIEK